MFSKKILVIKQTAEGFSSGIKPLCGICRLEKENDVLTVFLSLIGFAAINAGEYRLYIVGDDKTVIEKNLGKIPASAVFSMRNAINLNKGVSVGVWTVKDDIPLLVAFQKSDDARLSVKDYDAAVINAIIAERKLREREKEFAVFPPDLPEQAVTPTPAAPQPQIEQDVTETPDFSFAPAGVYNDEAVATENYYDTNDFIDEDDAIKQKLLSIKELSDEYLRREQSDAENAGGKAVSECNNKAGAFGGENTPYYLTVKDELDGIFAKFPAETTLEKAFEGSRFAKVYYTDDKYYVVGLVKENGKEKYICYGVPSAYRETPPKELAGYCSFVPLSIFDLKGDGYFMMFQDAITGKCVHKV